MFMSFCRLLMASLLFLVGSCLSQDRGGVDQTVAVPVGAKNPKQRTTFGIA